MATVKSDKPSGLSIKRSDQAFTCSWKIPSGGYESQQFHWRTSDLWRDKKKGVVLWIHAPKTGGSNPPYDGTNKSIGTASSIMIPIYRKNFYPTSGKPKINAFQFHIQGTKKKDNKNTYTVSDFVTKTFDIKVPPKPTITKDVQTWPSVKFTWKVDYKKDNANYYTDIIYESMLVKNCSITDGSKFKAWDGSKGTDNKALNPNFVSGTRVTKNVAYPTVTGSVTEKEDSGRLADGNTYTRWVRVKSRGPAGDSAWAYASYIYAIPNQSTIDKEKTKVTSISSTDGYNIKLYFNSPFDSALHPMQKVQVQYAIAIPEEGMTCPDSASWQDGGTVLPKDASSGAILDIDSLIGLDQCLFVRVNSAYENRTTYGVPTILDVGTLKAPESFSIDPNSENHKITVNATNASSVPDSFMVVRYYENDSSEGYDIGIIEHGKNQGIIQAPEWNPPSPSIGVRAVVGSYTISANYRTTSDALEIFGKEYYQRTGTGTNNDPYVYNPYTFINPKYDYRYYKKIYELDNSTFVGTQDTVVDTSKDYYNDGYMIEHTESNPTLSWPIIEDTDLRYTDKTYYKLVKFSDNFDFFSLIRGREKNPITKYNCIRFFIVDSEENITNALVFTESYDIRNAVEESDGSYTYTFLDYTFNEVTINSKDIVDTVRFLIDPNTSYSSSWIDTLPFYTFTDSNFFINNELKTYNNKPNSLGLYETYDSEVNVYTVNALMESKTIRDGGEIPLAPYNIDARQTDIPGTIRVTWDWSDKDATQAELSWADHIDAWESTDEPSTYVISRLRNGAWNISGLTTGQKWYIRVRLISGTNDNPLYSEYSDIYTVDLSSAPNVPTLTMSPENGIITNDGELTLSWEYSSSDGTNQMNASIYEVITDSETGNVTYNELTQVGSQQDYTISAANPTKSDDPELTTPWAIGESHSFAIKVTSEANKTSDYSNTVTVTVAEPISFEIDTENLVGFEDVQVSTIDEQGNPTTDTQYSLIEMPFTIAVTGVKDEETMIVAVERDENYHVDRPDETDFDGFLGETVAQMPSQNGGNPVTVNLTDLIGSLDDGAKYVIKVTVSDSLGQSQEQTLPFVVNWTHQPGVPSATVTIDEENAIAILTPTIDPNDYSYGDVCDIYRLSVDKPVLIYSGAEFGTSYVDPYPTIGEYGGHRFVTRTNNGDYVIGNGPSGDFAWVDTREEDGDRFDTHSNIIDFGNGKAYVLYEVDMSSSWAKDFKETKYLGGHVQGDWNKAISRTGSISVTAVSDYDQETIQTMRRLAEYPGICHIRSKDGSSYFADVQVSETYEYTRAPRLNKYDLTITRVDPEEFEGMTLEDWNRTHEEESE